MDDQKKATVLNYISVISGEKVDSLLDLRNGRFYMQVLGLLDQWNKNVCFETDMDRLTCVRTFLQDYYGHDVTLDEFLKFDAILEPDSRWSEIQLELELAKIAVVLLGIGVLDKNGQHFIGSAMQLPPEMHFDVMAIIQSVVQAGSTEVSLTANIEKVLLEPSEDFKSPPATSLQKSHFMDPTETSTPKEPRFCSSSFATKSFYQKDSPLRLNSSGLNYSLREITSPLRGLSIDVAAPSSPLAQFVQSPQLLQKAIIKQKELEIRKLKQLLSDQAFIKDEIQFSLQDKTTECANKDGEISKLQDKIRDLMHMRDSYDEFQDLKLRYSEMEIEMARLSKKLQSCEQYKEECQLLEKENHEHCSEVERLHQDIAALQVEANKYRDCLKTISGLQLQVNSLQLQLDVMHKSKSDWDAERGALQGNLEMAKETIDKLRQELDELLSKQEESAPGESMGIFMDIQLGEVRCQLDELKQEKELMLQQIQELTNLVSSKDCELDKLNSLLCEKDEAIMKMNDIAKNKEQQLEMVKKMTDLKEENIVKLQETVDTYEREIESLKDVTNKKNEQINELENVQCMLQEQLEVLKNEITAKETQCLEGNSKVASLSDRILLLESELQTEKHSLATLSEVKANLECMLDKKLNEINCLHSDLSVKSEMLSQQQMDNTVTQGQLQCKEMELVDLCRVIEKQKEEVTEIKQQLNSKTAAVDMLTATLNVKSADIANLQERERSVCEEAKSLKITCEKLTDENEKYQQLLSSMGSELQQVRDELTARNAELSNVNKNVNSLMESLEEKSTTCMELGDAISQCSDELLKAKTEVDHLKNELVLSENTMKELKEYTQQKDEQLQTLDAAKCRLEEQIQIVNTTVHAKETECREHMHNVSCLTEKLSDLQQERESQSQELITVCETKCKLEEALKMKEQELSHSQNNLSLNTETLFKLEVERNNVNEDLRCKEMEIEDLCRKLADKEEESVKMKKQLAANSSDCEKLKDALDNRNTEVSSLQEQILSLEESIRCLQVRCEQLEAGNHRDKQRQNDTDAELQHVRNELTAKNSEMAALTEEMGKLKKSMEEKATVCKELQDLTSHQSDELVKTQAEREQLKNEALHFENELTARNSQMAALTEEIGRLKESVEEKATVCKELQDLTSHQSDELVKTQAEREQLKNEALHFENELTARNSQMAALTEEIGRLKESVEEKATVCKELQDLTSHQSDELVKTQAEREQLKNEALHFENELTARNSQMAALTEEIGRLKESVEEKATMCKELQALTSHHSDELVKTQAEREQMKNELLHFESEVKELKESVHQKSEQLQTAQVVQSRLKEQLSSLNSQIQAKVDECLKHNEQLLLLTEQVSDLKRELHSKHQDLKTVCEEKSSLQAELKKEQEQLDSLQKDLLCKNETISRLETERNFAEECLKSKDVENEHLHLELAKYKEEIAGIQEQLVTKAVTIDELTQTVHLKSTEITNLQTQKRALDDAIARLVCDYEELKVKSETCEQQLKSSEIECQQLRDKLAAEVEQLSTLNNELNILKKSGEEKTVVHKELQKLVSQRSDELLKAQGERDQAKEELCHYKNEVKDLRESLQQQTEQLETVRCLQCQLEEQIQKLNSQITDSAKENSEYSQKVSLLTEKISDLEQERQCQSHSLSSLTAVKTKLEDYLEKEEEKVNRLQNDLADKKEIISTLEAERDTAQEQLSSTKLDNEDLQLEIVKLKEEIAEVTEQLVSKSATLGEMMETLKLKNAEAVELQAQKTSTDNARDSLQITCDKLKTENAYLMQQLSINETELQQAKDKLTELKGLVEDKSNLCKKMQDIISQHSIELQQKQNDRDQIKNELEEHIENLKEQVRMKSNAVEELTSMLNLKDVDVNDKIQLIEDLTQTVAARESRISDLCLKLEERTNCVSKLQEEIKSTEQQVAHLTKTTQEQSSSINELTVILQAKESAISEANNELQKQISINMLKSNENAELSEQITVSAKEMEELRAEIKSLRNLLEEKYDMLKAVNDELLGKEAVILEKRDELIQAHSSLQAIQEQLTCREEDVHSLETQLKEVNLTLQNTVDILTKRDQAITQKDLSEQELSIKLSQVTSLLQEKVNEVSIKNSAIESMQEQHKSELATIKQETDNVLNCLQDKLDCRESEILRLAQQKADLESQKADLALQMATLVSGHRAELADLADGHLKAMTSAESHYQDIASAKEAEILKLEQQIADLTEQNEAKIQTIDSAHETRLRQLCEDLKLELEAQKQMEQDLIAQKERTERLEAAMEQEKVSHEKSVQSILQEHDKKLSLVEQDHSSQVAILMSEKDQLLEEIENYKAQVSKLHENASELHVNHMQKVEDLQHQQSLLIKEHELLLLQEKATQDKERQTLNEALTARKKELEKLQADMEMVQSQLTEAKDNIVHHERKIKTLQEENKSFLEREKKLLKEGDSQMRTANEFCVSLRKQLETSNTQLESRDKELKTLNDQIRRYEQHLSKMKETNASLTNALKIERDTNSKLQKRMESFNSKYADMKAQYESMVKENKSYATEVNKLKTALDYSDRKLREYQHQLDKAGTALLGDASHFKQMLEEKHYDSLDDSIDGRSTSVKSRTLRSQSSLSSGSVGSKASLNETVSSDWGTLKRDTRAGTADLREKAMRQTEDRISICSTSSAQSVKSITSITGLPNALSCADEPDGTDFEWNRLRELQRRNTLYLPHMKSAYPVEMQMTNKEKFTDDSLRLSLLPSRRGRVSPGEYMRQKELESMSNKRKAAAKQSMEEVSGESPLKQIRTGPVYQRPGPPTPGKQPRRISGRFTPSHGISPMPGGKVKVLGSPIARPNPRRSCTPSMRTPRRSPRINSPMSPVSTNTNEEHQESVAFNIGFTPKKSSAPKKFLRQKGFFSKDKDKVKEKDKSKAVTAASEATVQLGKGKTGQKTGQVSFTASSYDSARQDVYGSTNSTAEAQPQPDVQKKTIGEITSSPFKSHIFHGVFTGIEIEAQQKLETDLCVNIRNEHLNAVCNKSVVTVGQAEPQTNCKLLRNHKLDIHFPRVNDVLDAAGTLKPRIILVNDSKTTVSNSRHNINTSAKTRQFYCNSPNRTEHVTCFEPPNLLNVDRGSYSAMTETTCLSVSKHQSVHLLAQSANVIQSPMSGEERSENVPSSSKIACPGKLVELSEANNACKCPSLKRQHVNDGTKDSCRSESSAKRRLVFSEDSPCSKIVSTENDNNVVLPIPQTKKRTKTAVKTAISFFKKEPKNKTLTKSTVKLPTPKQEIKYNFSELKHEIQDKQSPSCVNDFNISGIFTVSQQISQDVPDNRTGGLAEPTILQSVNEIMHIPDVCEKKKFKFSNHIKKALPFWKKPSVANDVAHVESAQQKPACFERSAQGVSNQPSPLVQAQSKGVLQSHLKSDQSSPLVQVQNKDVLENDDVKKPPLKLTTFQGKKFGQNVFNLRAKFESKKPKVDEIVEYKGKEALNKKILNENVNKIQTLKTVTVSGTNKMSPKTNATARVLTNTTKYTVDQSKFSRVCKTRPDLADSAAYTESTHGSSVLSPYRQNMADLAESYPVLSKGTLTFTYRQDMEDLTQSTPGLCRAALPSTYRQDMDNLAESSPGLCRATLPGRHTPMREFLPTQNDSNFKSSPKMREISSTCESWIKIIQDDVNVVMTPVDKKHKFLAFHTNKVTPIGKKVTHF
ncbi:hypothetical protein BsWGS_17890 [Bradybaena similaris]